MLLLQVNRAQVLFKKAAKRYNSGIPSSAPDATFSYWCKFYGDNPDERDDSISLIEPSIYNRLESKISVQKLLREHIVDDVFPAGYLSVTEALAHPEPVAVWFAKPGHLSGGRGIEVISGTELRHYTLPRFYMLQAGVEDLELIDGRKFTARIYVLLWNRKAFLFDEGFVLVHGPAYVRGSTDYGVQVDHRGYEREDSGVEMALCSDRAVTRSLVAEACKPLRRMLPILEEACVATSPLRYLLLGIDVLQKADGSVTFIELNAIPNFIHSKRVNERLNILLFEQLMRMTTGMGSDRFVRLEPAGVEKQASSP